MREIESGIVAIKLTAIRTRSEVRKIRKWETEKNRVAHTITRVIQIRNVSRRRVGSKCQDSFTGKNRKKHETYVVTAQPLTTTISLAVVTVKLKRSLLKVKFPTTWYRF